MTKVIILGQESKEKKELKRIEFIKSLENNLKIHDSAYYPENYDYIELICKNYTENYDLMFAYNNIRSQGVLIIGHFNDGEV